MKRISWKSSVDLIHCALVKSGPPRYRLLNEIKSTWAQQTWLHRRAPCDSIYLFMNLDGCSTRFTGRCVWSRNILQIPRMSDKRFIKQRGSGSSALSHPLMHKIQVGITSSHLILTLVRLPGEFAHRDPLEWALPGCEISANQRPGKGYDVVPPLHKQNLKEADVPLYLNESKCVTACRITTRHNRSQFLQRI